MPNPAAEALAAFFLVATLAGAVVRPRGLPEVTIALPAAAILVLTGALPLGQAAQEGRALGPTLGFLAAVLVLASLCDGYGLFEAAGRWMSAASRRSPTRLLGVVFVVASLTTAALSLDATVVLLTPVVLATAARMHLRSRPPAYACTHLANTASLLLPISNLTNLLAYRASGLSFASFGLTMALPWAAAIAVEWLLLRRFFRSDLVGRGQAAPREAAGTPWYALAVVLLTLGGFFATSILGVYPAWAALAGVVLLGVPGVVSHRVQLRNVGDAVDVPFLAFIFSLALVVRALSLHGLGAAVGHALPAGTSLGSLLLTATLAAVLANLINNLPAVLLLLPVASLDGTGSVLAVLIGVNVGPNLTYVGSLATLLWRRVLRQRGADLPVSEFLRLGAVTVPPVLVASTLALWLSLRLVG